MDEDNLKGICRVCLDSDNDMKSIFSVQKFSTNWAQINEVIMICASVTIRKSDGLSDKVCLKCLEALHTSITFKETCERSHAELKGRYLAKQQNGVDTQAQEIIDIDAIDVETPQTKENNDDVEDHVKENERSKEEVIVDLTEDEDTPSTSDELNIKETNQEILTDVDGDVSSLSNNEEADTTDLEITTIDNIDNVTNEDDPKNCLPQILTETNNSKLSLKFFRCTCCKVCFKDHSEFIKHKSTHVKDSYSCEEKDCKRVFRKKSHLLRHKQVHKLQIQEKPEEAQPKENIDSNLASKELLVVLTKSKVYTCKLCNQQFSTKQLMLKHKRSHVLFKCETCSAKFAKKFEYTKHIRTHFKQHKCHKCCMNFTRISSLQRHLLLHENKHPLECVLCSQKFNYFERLVKHMDSHGKGLFHCETCGKDFQSKCNLVRHNSTHTGSYAFHCSDCGKGFTELNKLKKHTLDKHKH